MTSDENRQNRYAANEDRANANIALTEPATANAQSSNANAITGERAKNGYLSVAVLPFAEVTIDGRAAGTTPLRHLPLRPGTHVVELRNEGLRRSTRRNERIEPGAHRRIQIDWSN